MNTKIIIMLCAISSTSTIIYSAASDVKDGQKSPEREVRDVYELLVPHRERLATSPNKNLLEILDRFSQGYDEEPEIYTERSRETSYGEDVREARLAITKRYKDIGKEVVKQYEEQRD